MNLACGLVYKRKINFTLLVLAQCIFVVLTKLLLQEERSMDFYGDLMFFAVLNILLFHRACACIFFFTRAGHSRETGTGVGWVRMVVCARVHNLTKATLSR